MPKDLFSEQAKLYAQFRPVYPQELFRYILSFVHQKKSAWDCATGNGQAATVLADYFQNVFATDISEAQLKNAVRKENIHYSTEPAEHTSFKDNTFDLITVATGYHWFAWDAFYKEAMRVGKENCVIAVWAYYTMTTDDDAVNKLYHHFYWNIVYPYWDKERRFVEERYETVAFQFAPLPVQPFETKLQWTREQLKGYMSTWSAVQKYRQLHCESPVSLIEEELDRLWKEQEQKMVTFPISLRLGRVVKDNV